MKKIVLFCISAMMTVALAATASAKTNERYRAPGYSVGHSESSGYSTNGFGLTGPNFSGSNGLTYLVKVTGNAVIQAEPDVATIDFEVTEECENSSDAMNSAAEKMGHVIYALTENGVDESDITTVLTRVVPVYDYNNPESNTINGYNGTVAISVTNLNIDEVGDVIALAMDNGANSVRNLNFTCTNYDDIYREALEEAVHNAADKAEALAMASDGIIVGIDEIYEGYQDTQYRYGAKNVESAGYNVMASEGITDWTVPIQIESVDIAANVTVNFVCE